MLILSLSYYYNNAMLLLLLLLLYVVLLLGTFVGFGLGDTAAAAAAAATLNIPAGFRLEVAIIVDRHNKQQR